MIEIEPLGVLLAEQLDPELPLGKVAGVDRLAQIAPMEVRIRAGDLHRLVPDQRMHAELRLPVELHEGRLALRH